MEAATEINKLGQIGDIAKAIEAHIELVKGHTHKLDDCVLELELIMSKAQ